MQYTATVINSGTRLREDHNTFADVLTSFASGAVVTGELWTAPADGNQVKAGDKWIHHGAGWVAVVHKGVAYCSGLKEVSAAPVDNSPPAIYVIPDSFVLEAPDGTRTEFKKVV